MKESESKEQFGVATLHLAAGDCSTKRFGHPALLILAVAGVAWLSPMPAWSEDPREKSLFETVRRIFTSRCLECHNESLREGDLSLAGRDAIRESGFVEPGDPDASYLLEMITSQNGDKPAMPKDADPLLPAEVEAIRAWIESGADWPDGLVLKPAHMDPANLWSLQPIARAKPPKVPGDAAGWIRTPIDAFVLERLGEHGLSPSEQADRVTLIRRVTLDMLGLPPSPEEVREFVSDTSDDAYERLVDRVLASPRYGERWATHWLDLVRFAETHGFEYNGARPPAFQYRDYVIQSFNDNKPYDQFVFAQLAGDSLGVNAATGFLVAGPHDIVLGATEAERVAKRQLDLSDMINTTGAVFLGMTIGCARCHHHKFAPITQKDYYSVQAVFAGVQHGVRPLVDPQYDSDLARQIAWLEQEMTALEREMRARGWRPPVNFVRNVEKFPPVEVRHVRMVIEAINAGRAPGIDEFEIYRAGTHRNVALSSAGTKVTATSVDPISSHEHFVNDGAYGNLNDWRSREIECILTLELPEPVEIDRIVWSRDRSQQSKSSLPTEYRIEAALEPGDWHVVASSANRLPFNSENGADEGKIAELYDAWRNFKQRLDELQDTYVYVGAFHQPGDVHILDRGDPSSKREVVPPDTIEVLGSLRLDGHAVEQQRRVEFARSIVDKDNPLTPRVIVNRLWHYHFGSGIVTTLNDFSLSAEPPSHPKLLDWLAGELIRSDWSIKHLHRQILLSGTYRQSGAPDARAMEVDASSRLLWRYPMRRMEGEAIRDSVLSVSGVLDRRMFGPGFEVFKKYVAFTGYEPLDELGEDTWRRMIYMRKVREEQVPVFGAFDCPDGTRSAPERSRSTTPIQALNLFNDEFIMDQAVRLAERLWRDAPATPQDQVRRAFELTYSRQPDDEELKECLNHTEEYGLAALCRVLINSNEFLFIP